MKCLIIAQAFFGGFSLGGFQPERKGCLLQLDCFGEIALFRVNPRQRFAGDRIGQVYADSPLKAGKWVFSATILNSGNDARTGTAYLTVSSGSEVQKKRIEAGKTVWLRTREKIF